LLVAAPNPVTDAEDADARILQAARQRENLAVFFRSPGRIEAALDEVLRPSGTPGEARPDPALPSRLASQISIRSAGSSAPARALYEVRLWSTDSRIPGPVLRVLGRQLDDLSRRWSGLGPERMERIRAREAEQEAKIEATRAEIRAILAAVAPEGTDIDAILEGGSLLDFGGGEASAEGTADDDRDRETVTEWIRSLPETRHRLRSFRQRLAEQKEILEEMRRQDDLLQERQETLAHESGAIEVVAWPETEPRTAPPRPLFLALLSLSLGGVAGSLGLLARLFVSELRSPRPEATGRPSPS